MSPFLERFRFYLLIILAFVSYSFTFLRRRADAKRVLVIPQLTRIGDLVCATPVFRAIKETYPRSHLTVVVAEHAHSAEVIALNPHIDGIIILKNHEYAEFFGLIPFFERVRKGKFDCSINLAASTLGTLIGVFGHIPNRVKIVRRPRPLSEKLTDWMNTASILYRDSERIPELYLRALEPLNIPMPDKVVKEVFVSDSGEKKAERFFAEHNPSGTFLVGIMPKAGQAIKEWGIDNFADLGRRLLEKYRARLILIGAPGDRAEIEALNATLDNRAVIAVDFTLAELPSLLKRLSLFISADTGPMHMAHALGVPLVDIVGPVDASEQAPVNDPRAMVVEPAGVPPSIFALKTAGSPAQARRAIEATSVDRVFDACAKMLEKYSGVS